MKWNTTELPPLDIPVIALVFDLSCSTPSAHLIRTWRSAAAHQNKGVTNGDNWNINNVGEPYKVVKWIYAAPIEIDEVTPARDLLDCIGYSLDFRLWPEPKKASIDYEEVTGRLIELLTDDFLTQAIQCLDMCGIWPLGKPKYIQHVQQTKNA